MKALLKVNNSELSFRMKLNYNSVYSRLRMLFGNASNPFADILTKSASTTWYANDDAEYTSLSDAPKSESRDIMMALSHVLRKVKKEIDNSQELAPFSGEILEIPDDSFVFYRKTDKGYKFILAGWGCKKAHSSVSDSSLGSLIRRMPKSSVNDEEVNETDNNFVTDSFGDGATDISELSDIGSEQDTNPPHAPLVPPVDSPVTGSDVPTDGTDKRNSDQNVSQDTAKKKKVQHVLLKVINQNQKPVEDEDVRIRTQSGVIDGFTDDNGIVEVGDLPYHSTFSISFPNMPSIQERAYEVEPKVEVYEAVIKKYINYSPVLFVEDQNGSVVDNYNVKVMLAGKDTLFNTGTNGMIQLPTMQEGQKFIVIDPANYANSEEYTVTSETVKKPFRFTIKRSLNTKVGITVLDSGNKPMENVTVDITSGDHPCQQSTDNGGRAEFPPEIFTPGEVGVKLYVKGKGTITSKLDFEPETTEYTIQLKDKVPAKGFNWKWLMLLPLLLLLGFGGKYLYDTLRESKGPTISEMETGVCLILGQGFYYVDLELPDVTIGGNPAIAYFNYDPNKKEVTNLTFDPSEARMQGWWGTGFLISEDGLIATNRHIAAPIPPAQAADELKKFFQNEKNTLQERVDEFTEESKSLSGYELIECKKIIKKMKESIRTLDGILNTGRFNVEVKATTKVAFTNTRIENEDDFIACSQARAKGEPGGVTEKDLAIIQIKKKQDIPTDAFIFTVPEVDLMDGEIPDNYEITVLGYNAGGEFQDMDLQDGIKPQAQHGKITNRSEKYRIGYDAPIIGGSSGSPVVNNMGELVAINNSGYSESQGFNFGIRTKYLKELLDGLKDNKDSAGSDTQTSKEKKRRK